MRTSSSLLLAACALLGAACAPLGPDYVRPPVELPAHWKATDADLRWQAATPADDLPKRNWWAAFADPELDALEARSLAASPTLAAALARLDQALAQANLHGAALTPTVQLGATAGRTRTSAERPLANYAVPNVSTVQSDYRPVLSLAYEVDWLGKVRRDIESAQASAEQAAADRENVRLVLTAQVATVYFQLRQLDEEIAILSASIAAQQKVLELMQKRYAEGASSLGDVAQQQALTASSQAQLELLKSQRSQRENMLASLSGSPAGNFHLAAGKLPLVMATIPVALPSVLLERRPDIAAAERAMAAANAQIGVARGAYFPALSLAPSYYGAESNQLQNLFSAPALIWSLGLAASQTLIDGGRSAAGVAYAKAAYAGAVASYRQAVLTAMEETEDALDSLHQLGQARLSQDEAVGQQAKAYRISLARYREGLDTALTLALVEQNQLAAQRTQSQIVGSQFVALVALVKAVGGGWSQLQAEPELVK